MPTKMMYVRVHVQGDPELKGIGDGSKRFIGWRMENGSYRLFYVPSLMLFPPISPERFTEMKADIEQEPIAKPEKFIEAIKANRSSNQTNGVWDGGTYAMKIIDKLLGVPVEDAVFEDSGDAVAQEETPKAGGDIAFHEPGDPEPVRADAPSPPPTKRSHKKKETKKAEPEPPPTFQRGDHVYRKGDSDQSPGTITEPGPEQSGVKWDNPEYGSGFTPNAKLVLIPKKDKDMAATAAKKKTATTTKAAKAAKPAKAPKAITWPAGKLRWLVDENPRRSGTRAHTVVGKTMKLGEVPLQVANEKAGYTIADFEHDKKRKHVELKK